MSGDVVRQVVLRCEEHGCEFLCFTGAAIFLHLREVHGRDYMDGRDEAERLCAVGALRLPESEQLPFLGKCVESITRAYEAKRAEECPCGGI